MGTWNHKKTRLEHYRFSFITICLMFSYNHVDGRSMSSHETVEQTITGAIKTIQGEDGDIVHCVDIYKQPAFNHPTLKNHTIQMKPSSYPTGMETETLEAELLQDWHKNGECPEGTIPIIRSPHITKRKTPLFNSFMQPDVKGDLTLEAARVELLDSNLFGASARLNVWKPTTNYGEFSLAQIWVLTNLGLELNSVEAGWQVLPESDHTRLFISWTTDGYQKTGCYNLECPGFVQTNWKLGLGGKIEPVSTYEGEQREISIYIFKDQQSGNWWLRIQEIDVGYWPSSLFTRLSDRAERVAWTGEIVNSPRSQGRHTSTQMGSGHFPGEGYRKASYFRNIRYVDESRAIHDADPNKVERVLPNIECYDLQMGDMQGFGTHFFYGGPGYVPGYTDKCK